MKKILLLSMFVLLVSFMVACDTSPTTIVFLTNRTDLKNSLLKEATEQFEQDFQSQGWKVRVETITDYESVVSTRVSGNNYGDVLLIPQTIAPNNLDRYFYDFGTVAELNEQGWRGTSTKAYQGKTYGLPIGLQSSGILINTHVFQQAGVDPSTLTTPEAFLEGMQTIQAYGSANINDWKAAFHTQTATGWGLTQWAAGVTTAAGSKDYINFVLPWDTTAFWNESIDEAGQIGQMYQLLYDLVVSNVVESSPTIDAWEESKIWFAQGKVAAMAVGSWAIQQFEQSAEQVGSGLSEHVGYMPYPFTADDGEIYASIAADYTIGVAKNTKNYEIASTFAKWLIEDFNYASRTGNIPPKVGAQYPEKIAAFAEAGVILVEETPATLAIEGALNLAEKNAASSITDEKRIALWDPLWISDFVASAFNVRDSHSAVTSKQLLQAIQAKWNNGVAAVVNEYGAQPTIGGA